MENYKWAFHEVITELSEANIEDRGERMAAVEALTDSYIDANGERPDVDALERLTNLILREELTDMHPDKMTREEYPIMSLHQEDRRRSNEYEDVLADAYDVAGVNRAKPERRHRTSSDNTFVEKLARKKNRERKAQYKRDTSPGEVKTYNLYENGGELTEPFVNCVGIGKRWATEMGAVNETEIITVVIPPLYEEKAAA
ncbi:hypothetical protein [Paenibacillus amylolyticus]|uniref:hypothetical protein n=1 Tax=Paenibacillus amylolyticus TaxID=1451 RepID=UPI003EBD9527